LALEPKRWQTYLYVATAQIFAGEPASALEALSKGLRLTDRGNAEYYVGLIGTSYFMLGNDDAAIDWYQKKLDASPGATYPLAILAMAYARKGNMERSRAAVAALMKLEPKFTLSDIQSQKVEAMSPAYRAYWESKLLPAWRKAGLPE
jgi:tetratricopeptide (TPR) repeat protein